MEFFNSAFPWYKGNLHTHTTRSDGRKTPEEVMRLYRERGYDFLALTDHRKQSPGGDYDGMLMLAGTELDTMRGFEGYHIVGVGMKEDCCAAAGKDPQTMIDGIRAAGGRAILAHPAWSLLLPNEMAALTGLSGSEVYNSMSFPPMNGDRGDSSSLLDVTCALGSLLPFMAADDSHYYQGEECRGFLMVNARELSREGILEALDEKRFYASTGPQIHRITLEDGQLRVECSPCARAIFYTNSLLCPIRVCKTPGEVFTYPLGPADQFVRVEISDDEGRKAWSSPVRIG